MHAHRAVLEIEVGPLEPETLAQPEAGAERNQKEKEVPRPGPRGAEKGSLIARGERRDPLRLVDRLSKAKLPSGRS